MENASSDDYRLRIRKASEALALAEYQGALAKIAQMFPMPEDKTRIKIDNASPLSTESPSN
jgi:hypothetical protein